MGFGSGEPRLRLKHVDAERAVQTAYRSTGALIHPHPPHRQHVFFQPTVLLDCQPSYPYPERLGDLEID